MLKKIYYTVRAHGFGGAMNAARHMLIPEHACCLSLCRQHVRGRAGIEIGGPSSVFSSRGILPLYEEAGSLDNCNFATTTRWEGAISEGRNYRFSTRRPPGSQYVAEGTNLWSIADESYQFLLSSHVLEHSANAIQALSEWIRIVKVGGTLILLIPHKDGTFDHRRPVTPLEHFVDDYAGCVQEDDLTHLPEIVRLHDLRRDPGAGSAEEFQRRSLANPRNRCLHHHVFDTSSVATLLDHVGLELLAIEPMRPSHVIAVARKPGAGGTANNAGAMADLRQVLRLSPFKSDRACAPTVSIGHA